MLRFKEYGLSIPYFLKFIWFMLDSMLHFLIRNFFIRVGDHALIVTLIVVVIFIPVVIKFSYLHLSVVWIYCGCGSGHFLAIILVDNFYWICIIPSVFSMSCFVDDLWFIAPWSILVVFILTFHIFHIHLFVSKWLTLSCLANCTLLVHRHWSLHEGIAILEALTVLFVDTIKEASISFSFNEGVYSTCVDIIQHYVCCQGTWDRIGWWFLLLLYIRLINNRLSLCKWGLLGMFNIEKLSWIKLLDLVLSMRWFRFLISFNYYLFLLLLLRWTSLLRWCLFVLVF